MKFMHVVSSSDPDDILEPINPAEKYASLLSLIERRQKYEEEHPFPPYSQYKTDINFSDKDENTLLHYAAMMGDSKKIRYCLENGINFDLKNEKNATAMECALHNNHLEAAKTIFEKGANCEDLELASCLNQEQRDWLIEKIAANDKQCVTERNKLNRAVELGNIELIKEEKVKTSESLLLTAAANGQTEILKFLEDAHLYWDTIFGNRLFANNPLLTAIKFGQEKVVDYLLSKNSDINKANTRKINAFMQAAIGGNTSILHKPKKIS